MTQDNIPCAERITEILSGPGMSTELRLKVAVSFAKRFGTAPNHIQFTGRSRGENTWRVLDQHGNRADFRTSFDRISAVQARLSEDDRAERVGAIHV